MNISSIEHTLYTKCFFDSTLYTKCKKQNLLDFFRYEDQSL